MSRSSTHLAAVFLALAACSGGHVPAPTAFDHLHDDTFLAVHVDLDALRAAPAFRRFVAVPSTARAWSELQRAFAQDMGFALGELRNLTFASFEAPDATPSILFLLDAGAAAAAARSGRPQFVQRGEYDTGVLTATIPEDGDYWLRAETWNGPEGGRARFDGALAAGGPLGARFVACAADPESWLRGPVHAEKGATLELTTDGAATLVLLRTLPPTCVGTHDVHRDGADGFVCPLPSGLVLVADELSTRGGGAEGDPWELAVRDVLESRADDSALRATLADLPRDHTACGACVWSELPSKTRDDLATWLGFLLTPRRGAAMHEVVTIALTAQLDEALSARLEIRCADEEGAAEVVDLLEDLLDVAEALRDVPPTLETIVEAIRVRRVGPVALAEVDVDEETIGALVEELEREGR